MVFWGEELMGWKVVLSNWGLGVWVKYGRGLNGILWECEVVVVYGYEEL